MICAAGVFGLGKGSTVPKVILVACTLFVAFSGFEAVFFETTYGLDIIQTVISTVFQPILNIFGIEIPELFGLTPARPLVGTWKTPFAVTFHMKTDFDTGEFRYIGSEERMITWIITATNDETVVDIEVRFTSSNYQFEKWVEYRPRDVSPDFYKGLIDGSKLTLFDYSMPSGELGMIVGRFTFTTDIISGTWDVHITDWLVEEEVYTEANEYRLTKQ
jgi:hypothetical protein